MVPPGAGSSDVGCGAERGALPVQDVLANPQDPCRSWVDAVMGRAVRIVGGSGSIWTRKTAAATGLMTTAGHVLSRCTSEGAPRDTDGNCPALLAPPRDGLNQLRLTETDGGYRSRWSPAFALYNEFVPAGELYSTSIAPQHEVSIFVVDSSSYEPWDQTIVTDFPSSEPLTLYDTEGSSTAQPTWAEPSEGARVLALGYPFDERGQQTSLIASPGQVLGEGEARAALAELAVRGDEEGTLTYDPTVEFFFRGRAGAGMSGAGVFDEQRRQVGVLIRGSMPHGGAQYLRALRMSYVIGRIHSALARLDEPERASVAPYLESP